MAWELGCKGLTIYVTGSREKVVLETKATLQAKEKAPAPPAKKPRPKMLPGKTFRMGTPLGTMFVTINENGGGEPFEVFMHTSKAGSETYAVSEAMGRLISYILRLSSPVPAAERLTEVVNQLSGIGGGRPMGFGPNRILSLPDGVARVLAEYLGQHRRRGPRTMVTARKWKRRNWPSSWATCARTAGRRRWWKRKAAANVTRAGTASVRRGEPYASPGN